MLSAPLHLTEEAHGPILNLDLVSLLLKGSLRLFDVGMFKVFIDSQCVSYSGRRSTYCQFEEADRRTNRKAKSSLVA